MFLSVQVFFECAKLPSKTNANGKWILAINTLARSKVFRGKNKSPKNDFDQTSNRSL